VQSFAWVNDLDHEGHRLCGFECRETRPDGKHYFAWLTDIPLGCASVITAANQGGRLRWKIENEGFNTQKNSGYRLEHAYSAKDNVVKTFYFLLQVAHAINQLGRHRESFLPIRATRVSKWPLGRSLTVAALTTQKRLPMSCPGLLRDFDQLLGSLRNYLRRLAEALRGRIIPAEAWDPHAARSIQIRFDSS
jgi:hypothetical protein